jgi:hypothetical protein
VSDLPPDPQRSPADAAGDTMYRRASYRTELKRPRSACVASVMNADRVLEAAVRTAKNILRENIPPTHHLVAGITVRRIRELVHSPSVRSALERSSDTVLKFVH